MKYLPKENITFHTQLSAAKVLWRLRQHLERPQGLFNTKGLLFSGDFTFVRKKYKGHIKHNEFTISRILNFDTNSISPVISGKVNEDETGTTINVEVKLHILAYILFGCIMAWELITSLSFVIQEGWAAINITFFPFLILLIVFGGLKLEAWRVKKSFTKLFEAEIKNS